MQHPQYKHGAPGGWSPGAVPSASRGYRSRHGKKSKRKNRILIITLILLVLLLGWPMLEPIMISTETTSLVTEDLPTDINHLRIVYVSDIHSGFFINSMSPEKLASSLNGLKADLILLGGDYATDNLSAIRFFQELPSLHARYGVLGIVGEDDRGEEEYELTQLKEAMNSAGVIPVVNTAQPVRIGNSTIRIAGLDDVNAGSPDIKGVARSVSSEEFVVLLSHSPSVLEDCQSAHDINDHLGWFDLALFGHTHGGQMKLFGSMLGLADDVDDRYLSGWYTENRVPILVSNGVGTSVLPARLFCRPQIHIIDLSSK